MLKLYQTLTILLTPIIRLYLLKRKYYGKEDKKRFKERLGIAAAARPKGKLIWVHAASVGESVSILPLIKRLSAQYTEINFLITTGTVTSAKLLTPHLGTTLIHQYIPVDTLPYVKRFLEYWHPDLALWVESELWPNLITQTSNICPLIMVNGRMSENSYKKWKMGASFIRQILECFTLCLAQSQQDANHLEILGAKNVIYSGNIKYATPELPADGSKLSYIKSMLGDRPVWVAASTHPPEEKLIANVHTILKEKYPNLLTIIIPRHPARKDEILQVVGNLSVSVRSQDHPITDNTDIYLADTMGELGIFYRLSDIVFIGGSLAQHGGQNILEPARLGCAIIVGPHTFNFTEINSQFRDNDAIVTIMDTESLANAVANLFNDNAKREKLINDAQKLVYEKNGIIEKVINEISHYIEK